MNASETPCAAAPIHPPTIAPNIAQTTTQRANTPPWHGPLPPYVRAVGHVAVNPVSARINAPF